MNSKNLIASIVKEKKLSGKVIVGAGGANYYSELPDKPQINGVELVGNKSGTELLLQKAMRTVTNQEIEDMFKNTKE